MTNKIKTAGWVINGYLSDKTMLAGPFKSPPAPGQNEGVTEVMIDGIAWHILHSGKQITPNLLPELEAWTRTRIAGYKKS